MAGNYAQLLDIINNPTQHGLPAWDNNAKQIEGETIQQYLLTIINSLTVGYQFMGVASENTSGGTPDQNVFYIAGAGTYNGFDSNPITIDAGYIGIIRWNGAWSSDTIKIADVVSVSQDAQTKRGVISIGNTDVTPEYITPDIHNNAYELAQGNGTDWSKVIVHCWVVNWTGGDKRLCLHTCYRNYGSVGSGIRIKLCNADLTEIGDAYLFQFPNLTNISGITKTPIVNIEGGFGQMQLEINWDAIPNDFSNIITPKYYLDIESFPKDETIETRLTEVEDVLYLRKILLADFTEDGFITPTGTINTNNNWCHTDFIEFDKSQNLICQFVETDNQYVGGIAFYDSEKDFISCISDVQSNQIPFILKRQVIPTNTHYIILTTYKGLVFYNDVWAKIYADSFSEKLQNVEVISDEQNVAIKELEIKTVTEEIKVVGLNDGSYYSQSYSKKGIGEYTKPQSQDFGFNKLKLRGVNLNTNNTCEYRIYLFDGTTGTRDCPVGVISPSTHQLIKEGVLNKNADTSNLDYDIILDEPVYVPKGKQIAVYLRGVDSISIKGTNNTAPQEGWICNSQLFSVSSYDDIWSSAWYAGNDNYCAISLELYETPVFMPIEQANKMDLHIIIPDIVYAVVGTELNIWNDAVSLSVDKGLQSPTNYQIRWQCNKGLITNRCFRFTPTDDDAGHNYACACHLYNMYNELIESKTFTIKVLAKNALQSAKNIAYFGDSLGQSAAAQLYLNFNNLNKFTGTIPTMRGTRGTTYKYDAVGGYKWLDYATEGRTGYRASVSGVTSISLGAVYTDGVANFEVIEVNITDGSGNILLQSHYTHHGTLIMPSGTLTKISGGGDDSVPYTDAFEESANPLWNDITQQLDAAQYKQLVGLQPNETIDAVSFQFGVNEAASFDIDNILTYIDALYHCFVDDNPNCKFIIGLNTSSGNDVNGSGNNYGATFNWVDYLRYSYMIRRLYMTLQNNANYPNIRIAPINLQVDRYYGYDFSTRQISQRYAEDEQYHNNYVHPGTSGYGQIGDAYFATYIGVLTE